MIETSYINKRLLQYQQKLVKRFNGRYIQEPFELFNEYHTRIEWNDNNSYKKYKIFLKILNQPYF